MPKPIIQCSRAVNMEQRVTAYAEALRDAAFGIGDHGFENERAFWESGLFDSAIEKLRGSKAATRSAKHEFIKLVLTYMLDRKLVSGFKFAGDGERHDWEVDMPDGRKCVIEAKGCLDGNNTNIFERPANADEFLIWSLCQNTGADPRHNAWSGLHSRLSAEVVHKRQVVDGVIIWDMLCGNARECPKLVLDESRATPLASSKSVPPPCIYLFPRSIPDPRNNPNPRPWELSDQRFLGALWRAFQGDENDIVKVEIAVQMGGAHVERKCKFVSNGKTLAETKWTRIARAK
jgi:hypothetical protein